MPFAVVFTDKELENLMSGKAPIKAIKRGNGLLPSVGTWAHTKLAVFFARWLAVRFAVWSLLAAKGCMGESARTGLIQYPLTVFYKFSIQQQ